MRILIVHNRYRPDAPSGENGVVEQESAALAARGHDVEVFTEHSAQIATWPLAKRATLPARVLWSEESRRKVAAAIARHRPDVVHLHNTFPLITPSALAAARDAGVPVVASVHNYKFGCANGELFRDGAVCHECLGGSARPALQHGCYRGSRLATVPIVLGQKLHRQAWATSVSAFLFLSHRQRSLLTVAGLPPERCFVKDNFVPEPEPDGGPSEPARHTVAFVGRQDHAKGMPLLIAAWDEFRRLRPDSGLRLELAGGGPMGDDVAAWGAAHPSVTVHGLVPRPEAARILGRARAAVVPSQWEETFGMVAVEAMAGRTAPIAPAHGAFPELIADGVDGSLFPPGDIPALVRQFTDVDDRPGEWSARGERARATYERRFHRDVVLDELVRIYRFATDSPVNTPARRYREDGSRLS